MSEAIIVAIIGAVAVVIAAIISLFKKETKGDSSKIKQRIIGKDNTQIGIQNIVNDKNILTFSMLMKRIIPIHNQTK